MKLNVVLFVLLLLAIGYAIIQGSPPDCDETFESLITESVNESMKYEEEKKVLNEKLEKVSQRADSLLAQAKTEGQKVILLKVKQHEKVESVDHYTQHELVEFFAGLETDSFEERSGHPAVLHDQPI